ncbi:MAG: hypothetical protein DPW16_09290 [Chloroflexi bacterium]|nr:hypothetical protein [Chloroflexota bacterium]
MRRIIILVVVIFCLLPTFQASSQTDVDLPILYIGGRWTVWRFDPNTMTSEIIYSLQDQPHVSIEALSPIEQQALVDLKLWYPVDFLASQIGGIWILGGERLLIQVEYFQCNDMATGSDQCAGYSELLLISDTTVRQLIQIDYHYPPASEVLTCWRGDPHLNTVIPNPTQDQAVLVLTKGHSNCELTNSWAILLDFSQSTPVVLDEWPYSYQIEWSPDGQKLAYFDLSGCVGVEIIEECQADLRFRENSSIYSIATVPEVPPGPDDTYYSPNAYQYSLLWKDSNTLIFEQRIAGGFHRAEALVWYDLVTDSVTYHPLQELPRIRISTLRLGGNFVGSIRNSYAEEPIPVILSGDSSLTVLKTLEGYQILGSIEGKYLLMEEESNYAARFAETGIFILRPDFQIVKVLLPPEILEDPNNWVYLIAG